MQIQLDNSPVECVRTFKYLWIMGNQTCGKPKKALGYLYRHFHEANAICLSRHQAIIIPILRYEAYIWDPTKSPTPTS